MPYLAPRSTLRGPNCLDDILLVKRANHALGLEEEVAVDEHLKTCLLCKDRFKEIKRVVNLCNVLEVSTETILMNLGLIPSRPANTRE